MSLSSCPLCDFVRLKRFSMHGRFQNRFFSFSFYQKERQISSRALLMRPVTWDMKFVVIYEPVVVFSLMT